MRSTHATSFLKQGAISGRILRIDSGSRYIAQAYKPKTGQVSSRLSSDGVIINYTYDSFLPIAKTYQGLFDQTITNTFQYKGALLAGETIAGETFFYIYDNDKELSKVGSLSISREPLTNRIRQVDVGNSVSNFSYNPYGELLDVTQKVNSTLIVQDTFTRDKLGRIKTLARSGVMESSNIEYTYDLAGRIMGTVKNGKAYTYYTYDDQGNRLTETVNGVTRTARYDNQDRLKSFGDFDYTYNAHGTLSQKTNRTNGFPTTYEHDAFGQLKKVVLQNGAVIEYLTDGENHRVAKKINGVIAEFMMYNHAGQLVAVLDASGSLKSRFVYATQGHSPDYMLKAGITYKLMKDHLGSILYVVDAYSGGVAQAVTYSTFGEVLSDSNPGFQPFGFAGGIWDHHTGLVRFGARDYDPGTGRWLSKDPILFGGGDPNLYGYVAQDPVNSIDPTGLYEVCTTPLSGFGSEFGPAYHKYLCANGVCGGQTRTGNPLDSPGTNSNDGAPGSTGSTCEKKDEGSCMDKCIAGAIGGSRPNYSVVNLGGSNCKKWADDTVARCAAQCGGK